MQTQLKKLALLAMLSTQMSLANADTINFMTYNIACMPSQFGLQMNGDILRPNLERAQNIANQVNQLNQNPGQVVPMPNVIAFEEAFDGNVRNLLLQQLSARYPYNSGHLGEKVLNAGSGLLLLSQYPILAMEFHPYTNIMVGDELLANKGFIMAKLKYSDKYFITVVLTHLGSGDAVNKEAQSEEATTSFRRGEQMARIYALIQTKASTAPAGYENLQYLKTFVLGDFNQPLNNEREQKSISTGMSGNGYKTGQVKYPGQYWLFSILKNTVPANFADVRDMSTTQGQRKAVDSSLLQQAIQAHKFTGSTISVEDLKVNKNQGTPIKRETSEYNVIDGMFTSLDGAAGDLQSQLVSFNEFTSYQYQLSDHYTLMGQFNFVVPKN